MGLLGNTQVDGIKLRYLTILDHLFQHSISNLESSAGHSSG